MWIIIGLLVALGTSVQDVQIKHLTKKINSYVVMWGWQFFSLPGLLLCIFFQGLPAIGPIFWMLLVIDSTIFTIALMCYVKALESSDLSLSLPILSFTPVFMLITSPLIVKEYPSVLGIIGVFMIVIGAYMLNFHGRQKYWWLPFKKLVENKGSRYMLITSLLFSIGANFDKLGVINSSTATWIFTLNLSTSIILGIVMAFKVKDYKAQIFSSWKMFIGLGLANSISNVIQMMGVLMTQVPYLIAVKRMSVLFSALYGFIFLKEKGIKERLVGIGLMILGVIILSVS